MAKKAIGRKTIRLRGKTAALRRLRSEPWGAGYDVSLCKKCYYYCGAKIKTCDYILIEGRKRPCLPGSRCEVFKAGTRERQSLDWIFLGGKDGNVWR